jgi:hypothetical protein
MQSNFYKLKIQKKHLTKSAAAFLLLTVVGFAVSSAALLEILFDFKIWGQ